MSWAMVLKQLLPEAVKAVKWGLIGQVIPTQAILGTAQQALAPSPQAQAAPMISAGGDIRDTIADQVMAGLGTTEGKALAAAAGAAAIGGVAVVATRKRRRKKAKRRRKTKVKYVYRTRKKGKKRGTKRRGKRRGRRAY